MCASHLIEGITLPIDDFPFLIGHHPLILAIEALVRKVSVTNATTLVMGESGTGKELVARAIHAHSLVATQPFITVNCGAISGELLESELFGHERGAFTSAIATRAGMFQVAHHGTIFLDEIGELSLALQVKLLRVLQDGEIRPVGANHSMKVDVRIIAATSKDLAQEVRRQGLPSGPLLSSERDSDRHAAPARAPVGPPDVDPALSREAERQASR